MQIVTTYLYYKSAILFRSLRGKLFRNCTVVSSTTFLAYFCKWTTVNTPACCFYRGTSQHSGSNGRLNCNALMGWILLHLYQELNSVWFLPVRKLNKTSVDEVLHIRRRRSQLCSNSPTSSESKSLFSSGFSFQSSLHESYRKIFMSMESQNTHLRFLVQ